MKPSPLLLQSQHRLLDQPFRALADPRADFAGELRKAAPDSRKTGPADEARTQDRAQEDDSKSAAESAGQEQADPSVTDEQGEDQAQTGTSDDVTQSTASSLAGAAAKDKTAIVSGRARDLRERTEHEFLGKTDLAQLAAQELTSSGHSLTTPAPEQVAAQPPALPAAKSPAIPANDAEPATPNRSASPDGQTAGHADHESGGASEGQSVKSAQAQSSPGGAEQNKSGSPSNGASGVTPDAAAVSSPASAAISAAGAAAAAKTAPGATGVEPVANSKNDVAAVGGVRNTTQLLRKLERNPSALSLAKAEPDKAQGPVPAAALRGLAAALRQGGGTVTLRLNPELLGSLKVQVTTQDAKVIARFEASTDQARQLLLDHVESLRSAMESRGLSVDRIVVERAQGWMPAPSEARHEQNPGGAGGHTPDQSSLWNSGQDARGQGQEGRSPDFSGQGSPGFQSSPPGGAGEAEDQSAEDRRIGTSSIAITDGSDHESMVMLRVDAVA